MAVPTVITDLNISAASNSPAGSDTIGSTLDDFLRANSAFIKQLFDICTVYSATVGGTANAITLTPAIALTTYKTGQRIAFKATGSSSGVVTINVSALGAKKAFSTDGTTQLTTGDITSGKYYSLIYDSSLDAAAGGFMLDGSGNFLTSAAAASTYAPLASPTFTETPSLPTGTTGVTQSAADSSTKLATTAFVNGTALTLAANSTAVTQAANDSSTKVATTAYVNPANTLAASGYQKLASGLILQWGATASIGVGSTGTTSFATSFATACYSVIVTPQNGSSTNESAVTAIGTTSFDLKNNSGNGQSFYYFAVGK